MDGLFRYLVFCEFIHCHFIIICLIYMRSTWWCLMCGNKSLYQYNHNVQPYTNPFSSKSIIPPGFNKVILTFYTHIAFSIIQYTFIQTARFIWCLNGSLHKENGYRIIIVNASIMLHSCWNVPLLTCWKPKIILYQHLVKQPSSLIDQKNPRDALWVYLCTGQQWLYLLTL